MNFHLIIYQNMGWIYVLRNSINYRAYVGKTTRELNDRLNEHYKAAITNKRGLLYSAMRKHGLESFFLEKAIEITDNLLDEKERETINQLQTRSFQNGYNLTAGGDGTHGFKHKPDSRLGSKNSFFKRKHSVETREKIRQTLLKRYGNHHKQKLTPEEKRNQKSKRLSAALKLKWTQVKHPRLGKQHTSETKEKISRAHTGKTLSFHHRKAIGLGVKGLIRGPQTTAHREKLRLTRLGRSNASKPVKQIFPNGITIIHSSVKNAAKSIHIKNVTLIRECCKGIRAEAYGFKWMWLC